MRYTYILDGIPGETSKVASDDTEAALADSIVKSSGEVAFALLITCEGNDVRFSLGGGTLTQGAAGTGVGHILYSEQSVKIEGSKNVTSLKHVNAVNGSDGYLQITPYFEKAV